MSAWRFPYRGPAAVLSAALACLSVSASGASPPGSDMPAYRAPAEPPDPAENEPAVSEPVGPIRMRDALALALMGNPELAAFSWQTRAAEARALQAGKTPNPEFDFRLYRLDMPRQSVQDETRSRVVLSQVFELGGKRGRRVDLQQTERDLAGWDYEAKRLQVVADVGVAFVEVLGAQRRVESLRRSAEFFEGMLGRVEQLVETGAIRRLEVHRVTRRNGMARLELQRAESELGSARFGLAATWGGALPRFTEAVGELAPQRSLPDIETVIDLARDHPTLARHDAEIARGQAALALARARRVPDITYGVGVRWEDDFDRRDYLVDFEISLPIFDRKQGEILEARYDMARARSARKAAEAASSSEIAEAYFALKESESRSATLGDEVIPAARATFEAFQTGFEGHAANNLADLLDARRDLARAEVEHAEAVVDYRRALATLEGLVGKSLASAD